MSNLPMKVAALLERSDRALRKVEVCLALNMRPDRMAKVLAAAQELGLIGRMGGGASARWGTPAQVKDHQATHSLAKSRRAMAKLRTGRPRGRPRKQVVEPVAAEPIRLGPNSVFQLGAFV